MAPAQRPDARRDAGRRFLKVGPRSAGSDPGPACYGRGGEVPTVTDANVILGYLDPDYFLGGRMAIDAGLSRGAIERHVATPLGGDVVTAAWGIHELANLRMAAAVRMVTVQRGIDPREFAVVAFGGAGPAHIVRVAEQFDITTIIVPPSPGVASAFGLLRTDLAYDYVSTRLMPCDGMSADLLRLAFDELEEQGRADLAGDDVAAADIVVTRTVDVRFAHQRQLLTLALTGPLDHEVMDRIDRAFRRAYRTSYGVSPPDPCVVVNLGLRVVGRVPKPQGPRSTGRTDGGRGARKGSRGVCFAADGDLVETAIYDRMALEPGAEAIGPALFEEPDSTTVCPPGRRARVDDLHNLVIT